MSGIVRGVGVLSSEFIRAFFQCDGKGGIEKEQLHMEVRIMMVI